MIIDGKSVRRRDVRKTVTEAVMRTLDQNAKEIARLKEQGEENKVLNSFITDALPFLKEAWKECFNGKKEKLLSAEERGMGRLIKEFETIALREPPVPIGMITMEKHDRILNAVKKESSALAGRAQEMCEIRELGPPGFNVFHLLMDYIEQLEKERKDGNQKFTDETFDAPATSETPET